jgi:hypothetical protein
MARAITTGTFLVRTGHFTPVPAGCNPLRRDLASYVSSGVINLDKPSNHVVPPGMLTSH